MFYTVPKLTSLITVLTGASAPLLPVVNLGYASYQGITNTTNGVTEWHGMRYAAPPLGDLRFAAPEDPPTVHGLQTAFKPAPYCIGVPPPGKSGLSNSVSEDCLFLDVFAPSNATSNSSLPVFFFIQGGGFAINANANFNGRGLVAASGHNIIVVTSNYRVGPYGFISGSQIASPNNGIKDQRKALEWVQKHISAFGGNPNHVVIGGDSAGAASVTLHLTSHGGRNDSLFVGAAAESQSFATVLTVKESQYLYDDLASRTGCSKQRDSLACLRKLKVESIQQSSRSVPYPGNQQPPLYSWNPVIDGDLIQDYTYRAFNSGKFLHVPTIFGDDTNGGTIFVPPSTNTLADSNRFLQNQFPYLTSAQIKVLNELYPNPGVVAPNTGAYWRQASNVYGEMRYMCPGLFLSSAYSTRGLTSYNYRYNVQDPMSTQAGYGVPHTVEINAIFGPGNTGGGPSPKSYLPGGMNAQIVPVMQAYWTSFIRTLDPNVYKLSDSATWEKWDADKGDRFLFDTPVASSRMENIDNGLRGRCEYLWSIATDVKQ